MTNRGVFGAMLVVLAAMLALAACGPSTTPAPTGPQPPGAAGGGGQPAGGQQPTVIATLPPVTAPAMMFPTRPPAETPVPTEEATEAPTAETTVFEALDGTAESLEEAWANAYAMEAGAPFTVTTSEAEAAALINAYLAVSDMADTFRDVTVTFEGGQITLNFTLMLRSGDQETPTPTSVVFAPSVDADGNLVVEVVSVEAEGLPSLSEGILTVASATLTAAISGQQQQNEAGVQVTFTAITVEDGMLSISGFVKPA